MKLTARILTDVQSVNTFYYSTEQTSWLGDSMFVYFQVTDMDKNKSEHGFHPGGLRYCPPATTTCSVTFLNIDSAKQFSRAATQPYAQDPSIWRIQVLATDTLSNTQGLQFKLVEPGALQRTFSLNSAICSETP
jgi:hypothetical protein